MAISEADLKLIEDVAVYYLQTGESSEKKGDGRLTDGKYSISETARHFGLTRTKVIKMLVTKGLYTSDAVRTVQELRSQGMTVKEIAKETSLSVATVSSYIPYTTEFHGSAEPSKHAREVREYRAYEKARKSGQENLKKERPPGRAGREDKDWKESWKKETAMSYKEDYARPARVTWENLREMLPEEAALQIEEADREKRERQEKNVKELKTIQNHPFMTSDQMEEVHLLEYLAGLCQGALATRNTSELEKLSGERLPLEPMTVWRLHLEMDYEAEEEELDILHRFGNLKGKAISRDLVVPSDIPLYALHYAIQRAFGWENSHLHHFFLDRDRVKELCENSPGKWRQMVGVIFRSPRMSEEAPFWADDYRGGSFRNWLRKKYTGPYLSRCGEEGLYSCRKDLKDVHEDTLLYVGYERYPVRGEDGKAIPGRYIEYPRFRGWAEKEGEEKKSRSFGKEERVEIVRFADAPMEVLFAAFDYDPFELLERLSLDSVLCPGLDFLPQEDEGFPESPEDASDLEDLSQLFIGKNLCHTVTEELSCIGEEINEVIRRNEDSPLNQVIPAPFAAELLYEYDYGDRWQLKITASCNCMDLDIDQDLLDRANIRCRETYRPVLIARDGEMVMDDVGGMPGFVEFLKTINPELESMDPEDRKEARAAKKEMLDWSKVVHWKWNDASDWNLL
jgi:hypothetical protein